MTARSLLKYSRKVRLIGPTTMSGNIYERSLQPRGEVSHSAFAYLFSEICQYSQNRVESVGDLTARLEELGYSVGQRAIELLANREKNLRREIRLVNMLQYVSTVFWKFLFNKNADNLEKSIENDDEYMLYDNAPITNSFVSVPPDLGQFDTAALIAGIIAGVLDGAKFNARVSAHNIVDDDNTNARTVYLIKFSAEVMAREKRLGAT